MKTLMIAAALAGMVAAGGSADEQKGTGKGATDGKDWCLLDVSKCEQSGYPLLEKIERLKAAIAKGTTVYSPDEILLLEKKLREAEEASDLIQG